MKYSSILLNKSGLLLFLAISTILVSGSLVGNAFAAPQPNGQPFQALDSRITAIEQDNARSDSFFDVFFDVFTVDSFFDVFTDLQTTNDEQQAQIDSFFDIFTDLQTTNDEQQTSIDSFFDVFTEISVHDADIAEVDGHVTVLKSQVDDNTAAIDSFFDVFTEISVHDADIARIDTEILALDLRGESCNVGMVVTGINADGSLVCSPDATGSGGGSSGQLIVVERIGQTIDFSAGIFRTSLAQCHLGEMVVGGGYRTTDPRINIAGESSTSFEGLPAWSVNAYSPSGAGSITALAECARIAP